MDFKEECPTSRWDKPLQEKRLYRKKKRKKMRKKRKRRRVMQEPINLSSDYDNDNRGCLYHVVMALSSSKHSRACSCITITILSICTLCVFIYAVLISKKHNQVVEKWSRHVKYDASSGEYDTLPSLEGFSYSFEEVIGVTDDDVDNGLVSIVHPRSEPLHLFDDGATGRYSFCCDTALVGERNEQQWVNRNICANGYIIQSYVVDRRIHIKVRIPNGVITLPTFLTVKCQFVWDRPVTKIIVGDTVVSNHLTTDEP